MRGARDSRGGQGYSHGFRRGGSIQNASRVVVVGWGECSTPGNPSCIVKVVQGGGGSTFQQDDRIV